MNNNTILKFSLEKGLNINERVYTEEESNKSKMNVFYNYSILEPKKENKYIYSK